jgi:hypothetical protein
MIPGPITSWSKNLFRYKTKSMVMDAAATDKTKLMKEEKNGPSRAILRSILLLAQSSSGVIRFLWGWACSLSTKLSVKFLVTPP